MEGRKSQEEEMSINTSCRAETKDSNKLMSTPCTKALSQQWLWIPPPNRIGKEGGVLGHVSGGILEPGVQR